MTFDLVVLFRPVLSRKFDPWTIRASVPRDSCVCLRRGTYSVYEKCEALWIIDHSTMGKRKTYVYLGFMRRV